MSPRELIDFALVWQPFDGGDEEIFPTFGITPGTFYFRVVQMLRIDPQLATAEERERLEALCQRKLRTKTS